jgi:hypothetical protein
MKRLLLCLALVLATTDGAFAETPEQGAGEPLSALEALVATAELTGGVLDVGDKAIDVLGISIPPNLKKYWEGMRIKDALFGTNNKTGEKAYIIILAPLSGRTDMPQDAQAVYDLKDTGKPDKRSGKPLYQVGKMIGFYVDGKAVDQATEIPNGPAPKLNDRCTLDKPCDEMKRHLPCPHHGKGQCEHMEKFEKEQKQPSKDRGSAI